MLNDPQKQSIQYWRRSRRPLPCEQSLLRSIEGNSARRVGVCKRVSQMKTLYNEVGGNGVLMAEIFYGCVSFSSVVACMWTEAE